MPVKKIIYFNPEEPVKKGMDDANIGILSSILSQVKTITPVAPYFGGTLRNSYMIAYNSMSGYIEKGHNDSGGESSNEKISISKTPGFGAIGSNEIYSPYVELGTRKMASQPHLWPSVEIVLKGAGSESALSIIRKTQKENMKRFENVR